MLFGCPEGAKITIFRGPYVKLVLDRQTTDFLHKNGHQNGPQNHWIWVSIFITIVATHLDPISTILCPKWSPK